MMITEGVRAQLILQYTDNRFVRKARQKGVDPELCAEEADGEANRPFRACFFFSDTNLFSSLLSTRSNLHGVLSQHPIGKSARFLMIQASYQYPGCACSTITVEAIQNSLEVSDELTCAA